MAVNAFEISATPSAARPEGGIARLPRRIVVSTARIVLLLSVSSGLRRASEGIAGGNTGERGGDPPAILRVGLGTVGDVTFLDVCRRAVHGAGRIVEQCLALGGVHLPKQDARLLIVVIIDAMIPMCGG